MTASLGKPCFRRWPWVRTFSLLCWLLWKNRCQGVMEGSRLQANEIVHSVMYQLVEYTLSDTLKHPFFPLREDAEGKWQPPPDDFVRLDTDGSVNNQKEAACGGVIRDNRGNWVLGFQRRLGFAPPTTAELLALQTGLQLCKQYGFRKVIAFTDSLEAYQLVIRDGGFHHPARSVISAVRDLLYSGGDIELRYAPRETIRCADYLAKDAQNLVQDMGILPIPHPGCIPILREDISQSF